MKKINWDYIAGFFDGEGCIRIYAIKNSNRKHVHFAIAQSTKNNSVLYQIQQFLKDECIDSSIRDIKERKGEVGNKTSYLYICKHLDILKVLVKIRSRVIVKDHDVEIAIVWLRESLAKRSQPGWRTTSRFTEKEVKEMKYMYKRGMSQRQIAEEFGTYQEMISRVFGNDSSRTTQTKPQRRLAKSLSQLTIQV